MPGLVLSASAEAEIINQEIEENLLAEDEEARYWTEELKRVDPHLELRRAQEKADDPEIEYPGCWYLIKRVPGSVDAYIPLVGPKGAYRPPGAWILEYLDANDLWDPRVHRDRKEAKEKLRAARVRAKKLRAEQRQDHMAEAIRAAKRLRGDAGMTKRFDLKKGPKHYTGPKDKTRR